MSEPEDARKYACSYHIYVPGNNRLLDRQLHGMAKGPSIDIDHLSLNTQSRLKTIRGDSLASLGTACHTKYQLENVFEYIIEMEKVEKLHQIKGVRSSRT